MTNEHNPIAVRISKIQQKWIDSLSDKKNIKLVRWLIHDNDLPLINGFYKLESSTYGKVNELIIVMLTDFEDPETFAYHISKDWIAEYEKGLKQYPNLPWQEFSLFKEKVENVTDIKCQEKLLVELLTSFQKFIPNTRERLFLLGIVPRNVSSYRDLNEWLDRLLQQLPKKIGITLIDYQGSEAFSAVTQRYDRESVSITLENMDMQGAYTELMQQGNPHEPIVMIRCIVIEMGKAAAAKNRSGVHVLGKKMLEIGQASGDTNLWAYTCLVYAGFLFSFKDEQVIPLLDKSVLLLEQGRKDHNSEGSAMLLPAYGYKAAYYNFIGQHDLAFKWFIRQVTTGLELNNMFGAISACKNAIIVAESHSMKEQMTEFLDDNFSRFYSLDDEELRPTEIYFIVAFYLRNAPGLSNGERKEMRERMVLLFGENWEKRSIAKISWFSNPQTLMEDAFSR